MRILIACEISGALREEFRRRGHDCWSADIQPAEDGSPYHILCTHADHIFEIIARGWDLVIMHPPCTYLSSSGLHWNKRRPERAQKTKEALVFFRRMLECRGPRRRVLENPIGCASTQIRPFDQKIQPYEFGEDASKSTCLWFENVPPLILDPSAFFPPRMVCKCGQVYKYGTECCPGCGETNAMAKPRWGNQTDSGQNKLPPTKDRGQIRAKTYPGIARAMAEQWGKLSA